MKIHVETIKEFGSVLVRLGEAAIIGGVATWFVKEFNHWISSISIVGGAALVCLGLFFSNQSHLKKEQKKEEDEHEQLAT
ncbi:hypothetical protein L0337_20515 [candidate division KSB1 bacterium]|nr:hypothetical protein [candidate division KSB1 bacterium]